MFSLLKLWRKKGSPTAKAPKPDPELGSIGEVPMQRIYQPQRFRESIESNRQLQQITPDIEDGEVLLPSRIYDPPHHAGPPFLLSKPVLKGNETYDEEVAASDKDWNGFLTSPIALSPSVSNTNQSPAFLDDTAWSPPPSEDGLDRPSIELQVPVRTVERSSNPRENDSSEKSTYRLSGYILDGSVHRPMTQAELENSLDSMPSLQDIVRHGLRASSDATGSPPTTVGPGGSQTTSSMSTIPPLNRANSRLAVAMRASSVKPTGRLAKIYPAGIDEQDWESISDKKELDRNVPDIMVTAAQTGSSLADISDSEISPTSKEWRSVSATKDGGPIAYHSAYSQSRHRRTHIFVQNTRTGQTFAVPESGNNVYRHPAPLPHPHQNPFHSSPLIMKQSHVSPEGRSHGQQRGYDLESLSTEISDEDDSGEQQGEHDTGNPEGVSGVREVVSGKTQRGITFQGQSHHSSAWLSTVSEGSSGEYRRPVSGDNFARVTVRSPDENLTGALEGTGARKVGSSLANASSPAVMFSSSSIPSARSSPPQSPSLVFSSLSTSQVVASSPLISSQPSRHIVSMEHGSGNSSTEAHSDPPEPPATPTPDTSSRVEALKAMHDWEDSPESGLSNKEYWLRYIPPGNPRVLSKPSPRHRRSSNENDTKVVASPLVQMASAIPSPLSCNSQAESTGAGGSESISSNQHDNNVSLPGFQTLDTPDMDDALNRAREEVQRSAREHGSRKSSNISVEEFQMSGGSRPVKERAQGLRGRPVPRASSPHLYTTPREFDAAALAGQATTSRVCLVVVCCFPPLALAYGFDLMDGVMMWLTHGEVEAFFDIDKKIARIWAYSMMSLVFTGIIIGLIFALV